MTTETQQAATETPAPRGRRRSRASRPQAIAVGAFIAVGATTAVLVSNAAPVGSPVLDSFYRAALIALCGLAGSRTRRWSLVTAAALVAVGSDGLDLLPAAGALALALWLAWKDRRNRVAGAVAGVLIGWAALHLSWPASPTGATAMLAALAVLPLWWSAYRVSRRGTRRSVVRVVVTAVCIVVVATVCAGAFALTQQRTLRTAADDTEAAARAIADGRASDASASFEANAASFTQVADAADAWWMLPTQLVPVIAQNVRAVEVAAGAGAELNTVAGSLAESVDYEALQLEDGSIDLELLSSFAEPVSDAERSVVAADEALVAIDSPWLVGPLAEQMDEFGTRLVDARSAATLADAAVQELPALLGGDGTRRYLLLLGNPAEARDLGGHLGNWAELIVDNGKIAVVEVGEAYDLFTPLTEPRPQLSDDLELPASLRDMNPARFPQNWSATAELHAAAAVAADLYPQRRPGAPLDGVLYADPIAFAALLSLTGPVDSDGVVLDDENAVQFLTRDQFAEGERSISAVVREALERFTDNTLPSPTRLSEAFHDVVEGGHLQFVLTADRTSELLELTDLDQPVEARPGADTLMVLNSNANPSKIDAYLRRSIDYLVDWDSASGDLTSRVVVTLHNDAPPEGLHPVVLESGPGAAPGTNRTQLSILSTQDLLGVMVDGAPRAWSTRSDVGGLTRYSLRLDVPSGGESTAVIDLVGAIEPGDSYTLEWYTPPLLHPDDARLILRSTDRTFASGGSEGTVALGSDRRSTISVTAGR